MLYEISKNLGKSSVTHIRVGTPGKFVWKLSSVLKSLESLYIVLNFEYLEILSGYFLEITF